MAEYIEREAAINATYTLHFKDSIQEALRDLPAADVRPNVRGEWISPDGISTCSVCGKAAPFDVEADIIVYWPNLYFCHNCGADMREETTNGN